MRDWATRRGSEKRWGAEPAMAASRRLPAEPLAGGCEIIAVKDGVLVPAANTKRFYEFPEKKWIKRGSGVAAAATAKLVPCYAKKKENR